MVLLGGLSADSRFIQVFAENDGKMITDPEAGEQAFTKWMG